MSDCVLCVGSPRKKKPRGLNCAICPLVLVHAAVLGWGWLCCRLRLPSLSCSRGTLSSELQRLRYHRMYQLISTHVVNIVVCAADDSTVHVATLYFSRFPWSLVLELPWGLRVAFTSESKNELFEQNRISDRLHANQSIRLNAYFNCHNNIIIISS